MKHLKRILYIFVTYIVYDLFFLAVFLPNPGRDTIHYVISVATAYITWSTIYKYLWRCGKEDMRIIKSRQKHEEGFNGSFNPYYGILIALPFTVFNIILALLAYNADFVFSVVFKLFNYCCWNFMSTKDGAYNHIGVAGALIIPLLICAVGYIVGKTEFSISDNILPKIIYKKNNNGKSDK